MKKVLLSAAVLGLAVSAFSTTAFAQNGTTDVSYDNRNYIPDPDNPDNPDWAVTIPSAINFTDDNKKIDASVELITVNGGTLPNDDIMVTVASTNGYKLTSTAATGNELNYALVYGTTTMSGTQENVATLNNSKTKQEGHAVLGNDKATVPTTYTDTLTYTVTTTKP